MFLQRKCATQGTINSGIKAGHKSMNPPFLLDLRELDYD